MIEALLNRDFAVDGASWIDQMLHDGQILHS